MARRNKLDRKLMTPFVLLAVVGLLSFFLLNFWQAFLPIVVLIVIIVAIRYYLKHKKLKSTQSEVGATYNVRRKCPYCGRYNDFRYEVGKRPKGVTRHCSKCGLEYGK